MTTTAEAGPPPLPWPAGTCVFVLEMPHRIDISGIFATTICRDGFRVLVLTSQGELYSISETYLQPMPWVKGMRVTLTGLAKAPQRNGQVGWLVGEKEGRWVIEVVSQNGSGASLASVRPQNMVYTPSARINEAAQKMSQMATEASRQQQPQQGRQVQLTRQSHPPPPTPSMSPQFVGAAADCIDQTLPVSRRMPALLTLINISAKFAAKCVCTMASLHMDPRFPGMGLQSSVSEAIQLSDWITGGFNDAMVRLPEGYERDPRNENKLLRCKAIAKERSTVDQLLWGIDRNYAQLASCIILLAKEDYPS
ncbi:hypothetical protein FOL47_003425 [Perkinsus chesapeaki]|uniref:Uncharacterized protein n=1 Tax=Perkinsus chesapeaki TaxID=330153 RepID=A0A7J6M892_PERCH|nr:hypothetical protein FOL47_003425 [Perkinsus chesapeaki]